MENQEVKKFSLSRTDHFIYIVASTVVWFLTGLWHGANYTFIIWGMIHGFFLIIYHLQRNPRKKLFKRIGITNNHLVIVFFETLFTLFIVMMAWIFFRAENIGHAIKYLSGIFSQSLLSVPQFPGRRQAFIAIILGICFVLIEWLGREQQYAISNIGNLKEKNFTIWYVLRYYPYNIIVWW